MAFDSFVLSTGLIRPRLDVAPGRHPICGPLRVLLSNEAFPDPNWDDFVVVVIGWWCREWHKLMCDPSAEIEWLFMDGPFSLVLNRLDDTTTMAVRTKRRPLGYLRRYLCSLSQVESELKKAAQSILQSLHGSAYRDNDSIELDEALSQLS